VSRDMVEMFEVAPDRVISGFWFYYGINAIDEWNSWISRIRRIDRTSWRVIF